MQEHMLRVLQITPPQGVPVEWAVALMTSSLRTLVTVAAPIWTGQQPAAARSCLSRV
ncbi:unnamed protein product [Staurois parvus]|uniref:Uncharacterized protein n=1 Tax=Staurois parvus TaxID=386267 RepID=A0ABN9B3A5_9NEOB|nr:unnamed protein product [Staurois parvus]